MTTNFKAFIDEVNKHPELHAGALAVIDEIIDYTNASDVVHPLSQTAMHISMAWLYPNITKMIAEAARYLDSSAMTKEAQLEWLKDLRGGIESAHHH